MGGGKPKIPLFGFFRLFLFFFFPLGKTFPNSLGRQKRALRLSKPRVEGVIPYGEGSPKSPLSCVCILKGGGGGEG